MFLKVLFATQEQVEACPDSGVLYTGISAHLIQQPRFGKSSVTPNGMRRKPEHISRLLFAEANNAARQFARFAEKVFPVCADF
jgi:hypothetical protein